MKPRCSFSAFLTCGHLPCRTSRSVASFEGRPATRSIWTLVLAGSEADDPVRRRHDGKCAVGERQLAGGVHHFSQAHGPD